MIETPITSLLGIKYPVLQGGMAWIADGRLAAAVSEGGGLGIIGAGSAPAEYVRQEIAKARSLTDKPFGVNIMLMSPYADEIAALTAEEKVSVVTTGAGNPSKYMAAWKENGVKVLVYRFPNLYGKWCRPNYNSAIATFCNNIANDLPITVNDPNVKLEVLYIDDLVDEMILALKGEEHRCEFNGLEVLPSPEGRYCYCPVTHKVTLGEIVGLLEQFRSIPETLLMPDMPYVSFARRLLSTYLSYLPRERAVFDLRTNGDARGTFTELVRTPGCGQVSVNISRPGATKGQHWHNTKWEQFIVVSGHGLIQMRREGTDEVLEYEVSGDRIQSVIMLPGYTHNIINLSDTEDLVTVMYANEVFDPGRPDTYFDPVEQEQK